jgi:FlaA1/EpsC-like NDP-sugar epimerase
MNTWLYSRVNQAILDACCFCVAFVTAYVIRFEAWPQGADLNQMLTWLPLLLIARLAVHSLFGIYRHIWKFVSLADAVDITKSLAMVSAALLALRFLAVGNGTFGAWLRIPYSVIALEGLGSLAASLTLRALRRILYLHERRAVSVSVLPSKRVLLYGAGRAGIMLCRELEISRTYDVVGFIDDDPRKLGSKISNTRVLGSGDDLPKIVSKFRVDEVVVSMAAAPSHALARTLAKCRTAQVPAKIIPSVREILSGQTQITQLREIRLEEVLGRESVEVLDFEEAAGGTYRGKRVLVTGAGGSIGSELVRQLTRLAPASIAILDKDENSVYELEQELRLRNSEVAIEPQVADVRDTGRLHAIFSGFRPQILFHAAAHKHVPLMEKHPCEAVLNNVGGTKNVLDLSKEFRVERFVFISSDKAVNPVNVMGATKRIGEMLVQASMDSSGPRFACVRFGNVLGSRGSVVPLFQKQIAKGGPVTITHPDVVRYFMTIQEAVQLILCAGSLARGGEIFVLDMGNPRNIMQLAHEMILLSGLQPGKDIETTITGLRPGEKLAEELVTASETLLRTRFEKLSFIEPKIYDEQALMDFVSTLMQTAKSNNQREIYEILHRMDMGFAYAHARKLAAAASN